MISQPSRPIHWSFAATWHRNNTVHIAHRHSPFQRDGSTAAHWTSGGNVWTKLARAISFGELSDWGVGPPSLAAKFYASRFCNHRVAVMISTNKQSCCQRLLRFLQTAPVLGTVVLNGKSLCSVARFDTGGGGGPR